ncbi:MAG: phosphotransferase [Jatrophihabitantaceae bacterium]
MRPDQRIINGRGEVRTGSRPRTAAGSASDLADLELRDISGGWDNQRWRLGQELAVRLPRTERASALLYTEQTWLPMLAERLPLPTPIPVRISFCSS